MDSIKKGGAVALSLVMAISGVSAPAPALTSNQITYVLPSVRGSAEQIYPDQLVTRNNYTGPTLIVRVREMGYADSSFRYATLGGRAPTSVIVSNVFDGRIVIGHDITYTFSVASINNLKFECSSTSSVLPYRTLKDSLTIW